MDPLQQRETRPRLPALVLPYEPRYSIARPQLRRKVKVEREVGDVRERVLDLGLDEREVGCFGFGKYRLGSVFRPDVRTHPGGIGDVDGPHGTKVIGESQDISPVPVLDEQRLEQLSIAALCSLCKRLQPLGRYGSRVVFGVRLRRLVARAVGGKVGRLGERESDSHRVFAEPGPAILLDIAGYMYMSTSQNIRHNDRMDVSARASSLA